MASGIVSSVRKGVSCARRAGQGASYGGMKKKDSQSARESEFSVVKQNGTKQEYFYILIYSILRLQMFAAAQPALEPQHSERYLSRLFRDPI